jgi:hypothetical protein
MLRRRSRCGRAQFYDFFGDSLLRDRDPLSRTGLGLTMFQPRLNRSLDDHRYRPRQLGAAAESLLRRIKRHDSLDSLIQTTVLHPRCLPSSLVERYPKS